MTEQKTFNIDWGDFNGIGTELEDSFPEEATSEEDVKEDEELEESEINDNPEPDAEILIEDNSEIEINDEEDVEENEEDPIVTDDQELEDTFELDVPEEVDISKNKEQWKNLATDIIPELEVSENNKESFKKAINEYIEEKVSEAQNEVLNDPSKLTESWDEKTKNIFEYIKEGGDILDIIEPGQQAAQLLSMNDEDLVRLSLENNGVNKEDIDEKIFDMEESKTLNKNANEVRASIEQAKEQRIEEIMNSNLVRVEENRKSDEERKQENSKIFENILNDTNNFMGAKINSEHKEHLQKQWDNGIIEGLMQNPNKIVEFAMFNAFGKQIEKRIKSEQYNKGKHSIQNDMVNNPEVAKSNVSLSSKANNESESGFDSWSQITSEIRREESQATQS